jgi:predicted secreted protein
LKEESQRVSVQAGQPFLIKILAQIGAGYIWRLMPPEPRAVKELGSSVESAGNEAVGADQIQVFRLVMMEPATQKLTFVYGRPFEQQNKSTEVRNIIVTAR